ncbi:MAG: hypothetical protein PHU34_01920 [Candidatus Methanoperedens sp.]|nr:hypothetical protein [Candidatus Methanoperedens sp.]
MDIEGLSLDCNEFVKFAIKPAVDILKNSIKNNQELISKLEPYHSSTYSWKTGLEGNSNLAYKHFLFEQSYNLQCSFYLALSGYYRYSLAALRNYLEMSIFFIFNLENPNQLKQWEENEENRFSFGNALDKIFKNGTRYNEFYELKDKIKKLNRELSSYVHPPRLDKSQSRCYFINDELDFLKYDRQFIVNWFELATSCVGLSNMILIIGMYDSFKSFKDLDKENILITLSEDQKNALNKYSIEMYKTTL